VAKGLRSAKPIPYCAVVIADVWVQVSRAGNAPFLQPTASPAGSGGWSPSTRGGVIHILYLINCTRDVLEAAIDMMCKIYVALLALVINGTSSRSPRSSSGRTRTFWSRPEPTSLACRLSFVMCRRARGMAVF
jgi:hypothetical protein